MRDGDGLPSVSVKSADTAIMNLYSSLDPIYPVRARTAVVNGVVLKYYEIIIAKILHRFVNNNIKLQQLFKTDHNEQVRAIVAEKMEIF